MRSLVADQAFATDYLQPFPLNNEFREWAGVVHKLDVWNFPGASLPVRTLELGATGDIRIVPVSTLQIMTITDNARSSDVYSVPDATGQPWQELFQSDDGVLKLSFGLSITNISAALICPFWIGIRVDGDLVAQSGTAWDLPGHLNYVNTWWCEATVEVGSQQHLIEPVWGIHANGWASTDLEFNERLLVIHEAAR